jgi:hypothetical protein
VFGTAVDNFRKVIIVFPEEDIIKEKQQCRNQQIRQKIQNVIEYEQKIILRKELHGTESKKLSAAGMLSRIFIHRENK